MWCREFADCHTILDTTTNGDPHSHKPADYDTNELTHTV